MTMSVVTDIFCRASAAGFAGAFLADAFAAGAFFTGAFFSGALPAGFAAELFFVATVVCNLPSFFASQ